MRRSGHPGLKSRLPFKISFWFSLFHLDERVVVKLNFFFSWESKRILLVQTQHPPTPRPIKYSRFSFDILRETQLFFLVYTLKTIDSQHVGGDSNPQWYWSPLHRSTKKHGKYDFLLIAVLVSFLGLVKLKHSSSILSFLPSFLSTSNYVAYIPWWGCRPSSSHGRPKGRLMDFISTPIHSHV